MERTSFVRFLCVYVAEMNMTVGMLDLYPKENNFSLL